MIEESCHCGEVRWRFDGFDTFTDLPHDGRRVADYWF